MNKSANILFRLLRAALGEETEVSLPDDVDWNEVIDLSFDQGVAAIAVDGLQVSLELKAYSLENAELSLDSPEFEDLKYEWFGVIFQAEDDYSNTVKAADEWAKKFPIIILKGLSVARKYPIPAHRESVDLDIYINDDDGSTGSPTEFRDVRVVRDDYKHTGFMYKGVMVEYHKSLIAWKSLRDGRFIEKTLRRQLMAESLELRGERGELREGPFASDYFNALFLTVHSYTHFMLEDGISLKHIIDWHLVCKELRGESLEIREKFWATVETFGMREFAKSMTRVADYVCKDPSTALTTTDRRMLDDILTLGKKKRFKNGHLNMAYNIIFRNGWKFRAFAKESNLACLIRCGWNVITKTTI